MMDQVQSSLSFVENRDLLRAMALQYSGGDPVGANNLLLSCTSIEDAVPLPSVFPFGKVGGRITSTGHPGCDYEDAHLTNAMTEVYSN